MSSFSGGTAETLAAAREAVRRGCRVVAITSGGELEELCAANDLAMATVPGGLQPRAALGHLAFAMLGALEAAGLVPALADEVASIAAELRALAATLGPDVPAAENPAKEIAAWLGEREAVVWGAEGIGSVAAMRWKTQINENGKAPAWHATMSELDHNEVVGWVPPYGERHAVIALRSDHEHRRAGGAIPALRRDRGGRRSARA